MKSKLPEHIRVPIREWRKQKRQELRRVKKAVDEFRFGCAYTPVYEEIDILDKSLKSMLNKLSVKQWGK